VAGTLAERDGRPLTAVGAEAEIGLQEAQLALHGV
jgi:hypothetical protein